MKTSYFTFGQIHVHSLNGRTFDKDCVVKITAEDPREVMVLMFGRKWAREYSEPPPMKYFPRGIVEVSV